MTRAVVEVFADIVCPFAHVGLRRVLRRRTELGRVLPVLRVRAWPLELVNGEPFDPDVVARHVEELREQVEPGLFRGFDRAAVPSSSLPALQLVAEAYSAGDEVGEQVSLAVRDALFEQGRDIADPGLLAAIAADHGVPSLGTGAELVLADLEEGRERGVQGSPEFFLDRRGYFCPALRIERVDGKLEITPDRGAFDAFLSDCFT